MYILATISKQADSYQMKLPLYTEHVNCEHSTLIAIAIRIGQSMGLYRDGKRQGLSPLETHIRRLVWFQLCFLDIKTSEAQGPCPIIRQAEFDTRMPFNIDDDQIPNSYPVPITAPTKWTGMTFMIMRFEFNEMCRYILFELPGVESGAVSLATLLCKIKKFESAMRDKYSSFTSSFDFLQNYLRTVLKLSISKLYTILFRGYQNVFVLHLHYTHKRRL